MADEEHLAVLKRGVKAWNVWRMQHAQAIPGLRGPDVNTGHLRIVDLCGADLRGADLVEVNLRGTKLVGADLRGVDLRGANLREADLRKAKLSGANLRWATFMEANLSEADLSSADLFRANLLEANLVRARLIHSNLAWVDLSNANLSGANLVSSRVSHCTFANTDLSTIEGLEEVEHRGPSTLGIDTIYLSKGKISEVFLRGAGVPEEFITYMKSLVANPIEFYSCFISYSTKDQEFAERLYADLQNKNVRCWFAPHDVQGGKKLNEQIDEAIRVHEKVLLILSPASMHSEWVKTEIAKTRKRELREKKQVLFPLRLVSFEAIRDWECFDADAGKDSAREIREYFIPDFSNWKNHDEYQKAFGRLMKDLKAGEKGTEW
jgi:uncharacterized protein YjbI with pentapeptide repeats